jgi:predicted nucleic acid-binding protein
MIYLDTSVALAHLLAEERRLQVDLWIKQSSSRLLSTSFGFACNQFRRARRRDRPCAAEPHPLIEMNPEVLARAREEFPVAVRSLDALHLASAGFLIKEGLELQLATYDERMRAAARKLKIPLYSGL